MARSQNTTIGFPLLQILLAVNRVTRLSVLPVLSDLFDALRDEGRQLVRKSAFGLLYPQTHKIQNNGYSYVESSQIRTHVCAHFLVVDQISSPLGVPSHGTCAVALVEVFAGLLGVQR